MEIKMSDNNKLTTVKILTEVYSKFKQTAFDTNTTLQRVVNRTLFKYVTDNEFRTTIENEVSLVNSGSQY